MFLRTALILILLTGAVLAQTEIIKYEVIYWAYQGYQTPFNSGLHFSEIQNNPASVVPKGLEFSMGWRYWPGTDSTALYALETNRYQPYLPQYARLTYGLRRLSLQTGFRQFYNLNLIYSGDFKRTIFLS